MTAVERGRTSGARGAASVAAPERGLGQGWRDRRIDEAAGWSPDRVARELSTDEERGLAASEAAARLAIAGPNAPAPIRGPSWAATLVRQFASKLLLILIFATLVSVALAEWLNAAAIGISVVVTGAFGFLSEYRSEREIAALHRLATRRAEVVRDGLHEDVPATDVVPGDLIAVSDGDVIPVDGRVVEARGLLVDESVLTGEPAGVVKLPAAEISPGELTAPTALYAGTTVAAGSGLAIAVGTGRGTKLGGIFAAVQETARPPTVLERRLDDLGNRLMLVFLGLCVGLVALGIAQGREFRLVVQMAVSLAVGAIPEGLPAVATASLAIAVRRLAQTRVLVRRLDAVEALGSTTVIVADKTGTLTENRMTVRRALLDDAREFRIHVVTADSEVVTRIETADGMAPSPADEQAVRRLIVIGALCNDAVVEYDRERGWHVHGDPSEGAIAVAAEGLDGHHADLEATYPRIATEPFTSGNGMMRTTHRAPDGGTFVAAKGAFERISKLDPAPHPALGEAVHRLSESGFRVFSIGQGAEGAPVRVLGALVLEDPLRADAAEAVQASRDSGVRLILATGDHLATAKNVARESGIIAERELSVRGADLDLGQVDRLSVVARASHQQKEAIVAALQKRGEVVAMTGDGVNDAAALRAANVGVAVGPGATDVAVEAADIVIADGRLFSLVDGIREGRDIVRNLRNAIVYLLTASFGTILLIALAMISDRSLPLAPLQILWLNLVVHVFPALALATSRQPGNQAAGPSRTLLSAVEWEEITWRSFTVALAGLGALLTSTAIGESETHGQTLVFLTLAAGLVGQAFLVGLYGLRGQADRARRPALWAACGASLAFLLVALYIPRLRGALDLEIAHGADWALAFGFAFAAWVLGQAGMRLVLRVRHQNADH